MAIAKNRRVLVLAAAALLGAALIGVAVLKGFPVKAWMNDLFAWLRGLGPLAFFACMVLLPIFGFPMIFFSLSAGPIFAPQFGVPLVLALVGVAIAANVSLTYWLARYGIRPTLERLVRRMGYVPPSVQPEDELGLAVLVRVTPGPPFFVQSYLLGLAEVRFPIYLAVSWGVAMSYAAGLIYFGEALLQGKAKGIVIAVSILVAVSLGIKLVRRRLARGRLQSSSSPKQDER